MASTPLSVAGSSSEFTVENAPVYDRSTPLRWVVSHVLHIKGWVAFFLITAFATEFLNAMIPGYTGRAFDAVLGDVDRLGKLQTIAIALVIIVVVRAIVDFIARLCVEVIAASLQRGAREELFVSLLGKSQTFHNRQKVGDIMARATNDIRQMNWMISPGIDLILSSMIALVVPLWFMFRIDVRLLIVPAIFMVFFAITLAWYMKKLNPV
ncbi:MAG: ABC transporter transmembrane domain-containing protein, partial [Thermomicrobiales bacterium]|nr:ABC transporter transmembrane domain-containing protein [Thermomicrobiales bacterium]